ncbi:MAG: AAA family ATPase [Deltaproteobacteria bacterium RIFCSPHIGHO2_12_FULL_43_9]|nr:MAG: AAA family ATPase [Deltaproteobacteria bacterium RIFCSPHIGHO2_12_FULL_43_9]
MEQLDIIEKLALVQERLIASIPPKLRFFISNHSLQGKRGFLIIGPRGVGKTTLLLKESAKGKILYLSADNPIISQTTLSDIAESCFSNGYEGIIIDEVHYAKDWSMHVKSIYDNFPKKTIWISDSSSLILRKSTRDLNRRFPKLFVPFLSFREYLELKHDLKFRSFDPFNASRNVFQEVLDSVNIFEKFKEYKTEGFRPIFLEGDYIEKILGIIEKTIFSDVPFFVPRIQENHLRLMNAIVGFLASSPVPTINIDSFSSRWSVGKEKLYKLIDVLEHVGLINIVRFERDFHASGKGAKIFFADPSMYSALSGDVGNFREAFVTTIFRQMGKNIYACKNERKGDFVVEKITLEIGGRNKSIKGADFVIRDDIDLPGNRTIPLWSLGMMY